MFKSKNLFRCLGWIGLAGLTQGALEGLDSRQISANKIDSPDSVATQSAPPAEVQAKYAYVSLNNGKIDSESCVLLSQSAPDRPSEQQISFTNPTNWGIYAPLLANVEALPAIESKGFQISFKERPSFAVFKLGTPVRASLRNLSCIPQLKSKWISDLNADPDKLDLVIINYSTTSFEALMNYRVAAQSRNNIAQILEQMQNNNIDWQGSTIEEVEALLKTKETNLLRTKKLYEANLPSFKGKKALCLELDFIKSASYFDSIFSKKPTYLANIYNSFWDLLKSPITYETTSLLV